ncbi:excisionase Xis [Citrobacter freundii]|uniref:excisionase Xis n=2 Tax=Citrobacter freundii TaxID=546 RepID=UPI00311AB0EA
MTTIDDDVWMTTQQICSHLAISARTLERYRKRSINPFPPPDFYCCGASNKWRKKQLIEWQNVESELCKSHKKHHFCKTTK